MKGKTVEYKVKDPANRLNEIIQIEIKRKTFSKRNNLSGEYSDKGGFDLYNTFTLLYTELNLGPFVKLNLNSVDSNNDGTESKLTLKRINGVTFNVQFWFILFFIALTLTISIYQFATNGFNDNFEFLLVPVFGILYFLIIELIAEITIANLIRRIEKIMRKEQIEYKKL